ncbi:hypothetical protein [Clostridium ihumii]|uniref:hypothetical protein n=1 Tax=Clostridium ihumii TaxID=1470356 RepID=UPI00055761BF|nr:hypothetical protein [Clostridium ihumii]
MTDIEVLDAIVLFLKENVASNIKLKKPPEDNKIEGKYELVNPAIFSGWLPHKNYLENYEYDIPGIIVMIDNGSDDYDNSLLNIRLKITTYDPGKFDGEKLTPNMDGYKDLLNIITKIRRELSQNPIIKEKVSVNKPIDWVMDKEVIYPYWSADLTFTVNINSLEFNCESYEKYL